jgi:hypothetical protein
MPWWIGWRHWDPCSQVRVLTVEVGVCVVLVQFDMLGSAVQ